MLVRARPPSIGTAPSMTIGRLRTTLSTRVIFMRRYGAGWIVSSPVERKVTA
jgi:hypothetical protein